MPNKRVLIVTVSLLVCFGIIDEVIRYSRVNATEVRQGIECVSSLPHVMGAWQGSELKLDELVVKVSQCAGHKSYYFVDSRTGRGVEVTVMVGQPGPMSEHVPEVCYPAGGYTLIRNSWERIDLKTLGPEMPVGELVRMDFVHARMDAPVRVWHGWYDTRQWSRPDHPRLTFFSRDVLFRLHVSSPKLPNPLVEDPTYRDDAGETFLKECLPEITRQLSVAGT